MQLITKSKIRGLASDAYITSTKDHGLYITDGAADKIGLKDGDYVYFMNDGKEWQMFKTEDTKDGWKVVARQGMAQERAGFLIRSNPLSRMISKSIGRKQPVRLSLFDTKREAKGFKVYELRPL